MMRFNGNGYYNGGSNSQNASCALASSPSYNAENVTSGAEIALDIWQQYQDTGSLSFLQTYFPVMQEAATFLLAYQSVGSDGFLHAVANAHETQWAVQDPTDDLVADQALFTAVISAATLLNTDSSQVSQLQTAEKEIEPLPRVSESNLSDLLNPQPTSASAAASADAAGNDAIGDSYQPSATLHNSENIGLEAVWPYGVIGGGRHHRHGCDPGRLYHDDDGAEPVAGPAGRGRQRVDRRRGGGRHHGDELQRPGDGRHLLPGRAAVVTDYVAAVRAGHRVPVDHRQAPGQRVDRPERQHPAAGR
jgi:hypothetical protein